MIRVLNQWFSRYFSDPEAVLLAFMIVAGVLLIAGSGEILAPVLASVIIAYLLQWGVNVLISWRCPRLIAVIIVFMAFLGLLLWMILILWPLMGQQLARLIDELPNMIFKTKEYLYLLPNKFPEYVTQESIDGLVANTSLFLKRAASRVFTASLASIPGLIALIVYLILVPMMVFFFLKDSDQIIRYVTSFLPAKRKVLSAVWQDFDKQVGNYVRGKVAEVFIVGIITYITFYFFHLQYAMLLSLLVGLSVLVPYVGAVVVTIPVVIVAFFQWGIESQFVYVLVAYGIVQALDGNVLVPLLFGGAVNMHPVAIIIAILVFGGLWGFWGIFFAIPLATLVKALLVAWPQKDNHKTLTA